jgi:hypothetical protein
MFPARRFSVDYGKLYFRLIMPINLQKGKFIMKKIMKLFVVVICILSFNYFLMTISNAQQATTTNNVYKYQPEKKIQATSKNIKVTEEKNGVLMMQKVSDKTESGLAMVMGPDRKVIYFPDSLGSTGIHVEIDNKVGHTTLAGLQFKSACIINIWPDGTIEVDKEGVTATDKAKNSYISRKTNIGDKQAIVMVKK